MQKHLGLGAVLVMAMTACGGGGGASQQESFQAFAAATAAMSSAQSRAIEAAQQAALPTPADLVLNFTGPCATAGSVTVTGNYNTSGDGQNAAFDLTTTFAACADAQGTLDGQLAWTSVQDGTKYLATMTGDIDWTGTQGGSASCDFDVRITVDEQTVTYSGTICGYNVAQGR